MRDCRVAAAAWNQFAEKHCCFVAIQYLAKERRKSCFDCCPTRVLLRRLPRTPTSCFVKSPPTCRYQSWKQHQGGSSPLESLQPSKIAAALIMAFVAIKSCCLSSKCTAYSPLLLGDLPRSFAAVEVTVGAALETSLVAATKEDALPCRSRGETLGPGFFGVLLFVTFSIKASLLQPFAGGPSPCCPIAATPMADEIGSLLANHYKKRFHRCPPPCYRVASHSPALLSQRSRLWSGDLLRPTCCQQSLRPWQSI